LANEVFLEQDFDGAEYSSSKVIGAQLRYNTIPNEGVTKHLKIIDEEGNVIWRKQLKEQVFERGWFDDPTRVLVFTLNYLNVPLGMLMEVKIRIRSDHVRHIHEQGSP